MMSLAWRVGHVEVLQAASGSALGRGAAVAREAVGDGRAIAGSNLRARSEALQAGRRNGRTAPSARGRRGSARCLALGRRQGSNSEDRRARAAASPTMLAESAVTTIGIGQRQQRDIGIVARCRPRRSRRSAPRACAARSASGRRACAATTVTISAAPAAASARARPRGARRRPRLKRDAGCRRRPARRRAGGGRAARRGSGRRAGLARAAPARRGAARSGVVTTFGPRSSSCSGTQMRSAAPVPGARVLEEGGEGAAAEARFDGAQIGHRAAARGDRRGPGRAARSGCPRRPGASRGSIGPQGISQPKGARGATRRTSGARPSASATAGIASRRRPCRP